MTRGTMSAAVLHGPADLRIETRAVPRPDPGEVLVEVSHCGVCGTDLHMVLEGWGRVGSTGGHEWSGTVSAIGDGVSGLGVGDAVVGGPSLACGDCDPCREARPSLCLARVQPGGADGAGAFADFICVDARTVVPVPQGLDLRTAALAEPLAVALHAVTRAGARPGQRALVSGVGPIGALVLVALRTRGVTDIVVSEPNASRRALATRLGATVVDPAALDVPDMAQPARIVDDAVDVALECSGKAVAIETACTQLRRCGTLVLVGTGIELPRLDPNRILLNELTVTGAFEYDEGGIDDALQLLASGSADVTPLVEPGDIGLDGLLSAMVSLAGGEISGKVLVAPSSGGRP